MDNRFIVSLLIQRGVDELVKRFKDGSWGIVRAHSREFLVPDTFRSFAIVPLAPTICLCKDSENAVIAESAVATMNRLAVGSAREYYMARDLAVCPL